jgi:hypothetical protein
MISLPGPLFSNGEIIRAFPGEFELPYFLVGLRIIIGDDFVVCRCEKSFGRDVEIVDLRLGCWNNLREFIDE